MLCHAEMWCAWLLPFHSALICWQPITAAPKWWPESRKGVQWSYSNVRRYNTVKSNVCVLPTSTFPVSIVSNDFIYFFDKLSPLRLNDFCVTIKRFVCLAPRRSYMATFCQPPFRWRTSNVRKMEKCLLCTSRLHWKLKDSNGVRGVKCWCVIRLIRMPCNDSSECIKWTNQIQLAEHLFFFSCNRSEWLIVAARRK